MSTSVRLSLLHAPHSEDRSQVSRSSTGTVSSSAASPPPRRGPVLHVHAVLARDRHGVAVVNGASGVTDRELAPTP